MLAVFPFSENGSPIENPYALVDSKWVVVEWGPLWSYDEAEVVHTGADCHCQDHGGGKRTFFDGTTATATYRNGDATSDFHTCYCWIDGGLDLFNDGDGRSNAMVPGIEQQPFVMFVRDRAPAQQPA